MHPFESLSVPPRAVGIHWFGQASFALKGSGGAVVQVDPYFPRQRPASTFLHPRPPLLEEALRTDLVLVTHHHADHTCLESIGRIAAAFPAARFAGPPESCEAIRQAGIPASLVETMTAGDRRTLAGVEVHAVWSKPTAGLPEAGLKAADVQHLGYVVDLDGVRVYITGDPAFCLAELNTLVEPIRRLRPQVGLLTCSPERGEFPSFADAARLAVDLGLQTVFPAHRECFVGNSPDLAPWQELLPASGPRLLEVAYNQAVVFTPGS